MTQATMQELQGTLNSLKLICMVIQFLAVAFIGGSMVYVATEICKEIKKRL